MSDTFNIQANNLVGYIPDSFEKEALEVINYEKAQWDDESVFLTDKIAYLMRPSIRQGRKYYYGIFDAPKDEITGEDKVWVPLTEWSVESVVKSVDLDTKDILIQPGTLKAVGITPLVRALILSYLKKLGFGQLLNDLIRVLARDGTVVIKTMEEVDLRTGTKVINSRIVDLLNFWIDPAAESIQKASAVIERALLSQADIDSYKDVWENTQFVNFSLAVPRIVDTWASGQGKLPYTEVWERWGKIKKSWVTKDHKDDDTWVDGHIVASGLGGPKIAHKIRINPRKDGVKPYEEAWYKRVDGRWFGRGVSEMLFGLQEYINGIINIRKSNSYVLQNGIFLIRKGSGLTPDMISSISSGGGLPVTDINRDVKQLQTQDFRQSSYSDEDRSYLLADRVTGAFDINRGEAGRASASATATLTQDRHIRDTFVLIQEGIGFFIERLIINQYLPILKNIVKTDDLIRISGDPEVLTQIDNAIVQFREKDFINKEISRTGFYPEVETLDGFRKEQLRVLKGMGKNRFVQYFRGIFDEDIDVDVTITDERFNRVVAVQQLRDMLIAFSRLPVASRLNTDRILEEILTLMGLKGEFFLQHQQVPTLAKEAGQVGRLLKQGAEGVPTEGTAFENAQGLPQLGGAGPAIEPLSPRLNINTGLSPIQ